MQDYLSQHDLQFKSQQNSYRPYSQGGSRHCSAAGFYSEAKEPNDPILLNQSSSTWRHSVIGYRFSHCDRFNLKKESKSNYLDESEINIPHTRSTMTCSQGFGVRQNQYMRLFPNYFIKKAEEIPAPGHTDKIINELKVRCISLGSDKKCKQMIRYDTPPIGTYEISSRPGSGKREFKFQGKFREFSANKNPASNHYNPKNQLTQPSRFNRISQGKGQKYDFLDKKVNLYYDKDIPGPGMYHIKSVFDKYDKFQQKMIKKISKNSSNISKQSLRESSQRINESLRKSQTKNEMKWK